mgnify:FL=1
MLTKITRSSVAKATALAAPAALLTACVLTFGGNVSGLTGTGLAVHLAVYEYDPLQCITTTLGSGGLDGCRYGTQLADESKTISDNGAYTFQTPKPATTLSVAYQAWVEQHPTAQVCFMDPPPQQQGSTSSGNSSLNVYCSARIQSHVLTANGAGATSIEGLTADNAGNVYVAGGSVIRKIDPNGLITTLAGTEGIIGSADGTGATASFGDAHSIAVDQTGNLYVADLSNSTIRKITPAGVVTTLAGLAGNHGHGDGTGAAAMFHYPRGITIDATGNLYVTDFSTIRKVTPAGVVTTLAGKAGIFSGSVDGQGTAASFTDLIGITVDTTGNLYVTDGHIIRKVTPAAIVTTWAGSGRPATLDGSGTAASFYYLNGIDIDLAGNLYVTEDSGAVRKISPTQDVTTLDKVADLGTDRGMKPAVGIAAVAGKIYYSNGASVVWAQP